MKKMIVVLIALLALTKPCFALIPVDQTFAASYLKAKAAGNVTITKSADSETEIIFTFKQFDQLTGLPIDDQVIPIGSKTFETQLLRLQSQVQDIGVIQQDVQAAANK